MPTKDRWKAESRDRAYWTRRNRVFGCYLMVFAWARGYDCVKIPRSVLMSWLGRERLHPERFDWLIEDVQTIFSYYATNRGQVYPSNWRKIEAVWLSRRPLFADGKWVPPTGGIGVVRRLPSEVKMQSDLALFAGGLKQISSRTCSLDRM